MLIPNPKSKIRKEKKMKMKIRKEIKINKVYYLGF